MSDPGPMRPADVLFPERRVAILADRCVSCDADVSQNILPPGYDDEYLISGLCVQCQDGVFTPDESEA
ncbi:MAG: hypothetical protein V3S01_07055 [Dehalococcoidia bacterium]